jgi:hypothetical protein
VEARARRCPASEDGISIGLGSTLHGRDLVMLRLVELTGRLCPRMAPPISGALGDLSTSGQFRRSRHFDAADANSGVPEISRAYNG